MLGKMELSGSMYRDNEPTLVSDGRDLAEALAEAVSNLPQDIYRAQKRVVAPPTLDQTFPAPDHVKPNAFVMVHDEVAVRIGDSLKTLPGLPAETKVRIRRLIRVRDAVRECLRSQLDGSDEAAIVAAREKLNQTYDSFVSRFGPISSHANTRAFDGDPDLPLLLSLEVYDEETKRAKKTAIFRERTIQYQKPIESVELPKEALIVSLNEKGRVDLDHMSALLGRSEDEFLPELRGAIFLNPQSNDWETDDQYLSGNVREKLEIAEAASITDPRFKENVEALKAVQPEDLSATEIDVRLGSSWVPAEDIERFCQELISATGIEVSHSYAIGTWVVSGDYFARRTVANTTEWGTDRAGALDLIQDALNLRTPTIYDKEPKSDKLVVNPEATEGAREKQQKIKERFKEWIWQDDERRERLVQEIQRRIQQCSVADVQRRSSDVAGREPGRGVAPTPESGRLANPANSQHAPGSRRGRRQDVHDGCGRDGVEAAGVGPEALVRRPESHARPVLVGTAHALSGRKHPRGR